MVFWFFDFQWAINIPVYHIHIQIRKCEVLKWYRIGYILWQRVCILKKAIFWEWASILFHPFTSFESYRPVAVPENCEGYRITMFENTQGQRKRPAVLMTELVRPHHSHVSQYRLPLDSGGYCPAFVTGRQFVRIARERLLQQYARRTNRFRFRNEESLYFSGAHVSSSCQTDVI